MRAGAVEKNFQLYKNNNYTMVQVEMLLLSLIYLWGGNNLISSSPFYEPLEMTLSYIVPSFESNVSTFRGKMYLRNKNNPVRIRRIANNDFIAVVVLQSALLGNFLHHVIRPCAKHLMFSGGKKRFWKSRSSYKLLIKRKICNVFLRNKDRKLG